MPAGRKLPLPKRFPNQWSTKARLYTETGAFIEFEGPIPTEAGRLVLAALVKHKPTPDQLSRMAELAEELMPMKDSIAKAAVEEQSKKAKTR